MKFQVALLVILVTFFCIPVLAEDPAGEEEAQPVDSRFVDLDGDGLNDNIPDQNHDGIPDFKKKEPPQQRLTMRGGATGIFARMKAIEAPSTPSLSNSVRFRQLKFCTRSLSQCRGGFASGEEFGPGNGIGQGALSGNCVGGICRF